MNLVNLEETILANTPEAELLMMASKLAVLQEDYDRLLSDKQSLPQGWQCTVISENRIRINALSQNGDQCHWVLDTGMDT